MAKPIKTGLIITGDAKGGVSAVKLTEDQIKDLNATQKRAATQNKKTATSFVGVTKRVTAYGAAAAVTAVAGVGALVNRQLDVIDATAKVSDKLGITTESLAAMHLQGERTGVGVNTMNMALQRMVRRLSEAAQGTGEAQGALKELNLDAVELAKLSPDKQFAAIAEKMKDVENQGDKVRLSFKLFDSEGVALINTLNSGAEAAKSAQDFVAKYGVAISRLDAAKIESVNDKWGDADLAVQGLVNTLTVSLSQSLADAADDLRDFVGSISEIINGPSISKLEADIASLESRIAGNKGGRRSARHGGAGLPAQLADMRKELLYLKADSGDMAAVTQIISDLSASLDDLEGQSSGSGSGRNKRGFKARVEGTRKLLTHYQGALKESNEALKKAAEEAAAIAAAAGDDIKDEIDTLPPKVGESLDKVHQTVVAKAPKAANVYVTAWDNAIERVDATFAEAWTGAFDSFKSVGDSIVDSFKSLLAELAHLAITKPIIVGLGFGGSGSALAGDGGSLLSGAGGGGGGTSITSLISNAKSFLNINGAINGAVDGVVNAMFEAGFQDAATSLGNYAETITSGSGGIGGAAGGIALNLAAGYAGAWAGDKLGGAVFGKTAESNLGATAGAVIGSFFGPLGTFAGGALGGLVDVAFGGDGKKRAALGVRTGAGVAEGNAGQATGASGLLYTGYIKRAGDNAAGVAQEMIDRFVAIDEVLTRSIRNLGGTVDLVGQSLVGKAHQAGKSGGDFFGSAVFNRIDGNAVQGAADEFVSAWLDAVESTLPTRMRNILGNVEQKAAALVDTVQSLGNIFGAMKVSAGDLFTIADELANKSAPSLFDTYELQTNATINLAQAYDGSLSSLQAYEQAMLQQRDTTFLVAMQIKNAQKSLAESFADIKNSISDSLLSPEELYNTRRGRIDSLTGDLRTELDPAEIQRLALEIGSLTKTSFNSLDGAQRDTSGVGFIGFLDQIDLLVRQRLDASSAHVQEGVDVADQVFNASADSMMSAATTQQQAAQNFNDGVESFIAALNHWMINSSVGEINA
ncbi:MAG: hypothetical protein AB9Q19_01325 [Candidatus Reddybacter sp.]